MELDNKTKKITFKVIKKKLLQVRTELDKLDVKKIMVFGSVARGDNKADSDIDFLIEFTKTVGLFQLAHVRRFLIELFERDVDIVTIDAIREEFKDEIIKEAKIAA